MKESLEKKLIELHKDGWSWTAGHTRGIGYEARFWKEKPGRQDWTGGRKGRFVVSATGTSMENALEKAIQSLISQDF